MNYEGAKCFTGHALEIISEGYGLCHAVDDFGTNLWWYAWAFTRPATNGWSLNNIVGRNNEPIGAWVTWGGRDRQEQLDLIQADMDARRSMPFDEERERARLMPV